MVTATEIMKEFILFIMTAFILLGLLLTSNVMITDMVNQKLLVGAFIFIFTLIIYSIYLAKNYISSPFLFEVSPNKQRCSIGYNGLPHLKFDYMPDADRMSMPTCEQVVENNIKLSKTPKDLASQDDLLIRQNAFMY